MPGVEVQLDPGEELTCTFYNTKDEEPPETGELEVIKVVEWNKDLPDTDQEFEICISGSSYPTGDCQTIGYEGGTLTWSNLLPGEYTVTETDPGLAWTVDISDSPATVVAGQPAQASVTNSQVDLGCTLTQGYWETHPEDWPADTLTLGNVPYSKTDLCAILKKPVGGSGGANGLISLAHQLIAAKLNVENGAAVPPDVAAAIDDADALIGDLVVPPIGEGYLDPSATDALISALDEYNNGNTPGGPPHCE
jgi:hypothetical protein